MARKRQRDEGGGYSWMDTYGDMVTLLLTFFVLLFSMSSVDAEKWQVLLKAFQSTGNETSQVVLVPEGQGDQMAANAGEGAPNEDSVDTENSLPADFDELYRYIKAYVEQNGMQATVSVQKKGKNSVYIRFEDNIFFGPDSATLLSDGNGLLNFMGDCIKNVENQVLVVRINGHTADPKIENYSVSDRTLSTNRANSVLMYFEDEKAIDPKKLMASGYGKNFPIASNDTPEGRRKNRRVEMMILSNNVEGASAEELQTLLEDTLTASIFEDENNSEEIVIPQNTINNNDISFRDQLEGSGGDTEIVATEDSIQPEDIVAPENIQPQDTMPAENAGQEYHIAG